MNDLFGTKNKSSKLFIIILTVISNCAMAHDLSAIKFERENTKKLFDELAMNNKLSNSSSNELSNQKIESINKNLDKENAIKILKNENLQMLIGEDNMASVFSIIARQKTWPPNSTLKVCFLEEDAVDAKNAIAQYASEWIKYGSIRFDFGSKQKPRTCTHNDGSQVRITFRTKEYSSLIGIESKLSSQLNKPTMHLANFDIEDPLNLDYRRLVLHEFGHALGFLHEHQHPSEYCEKQYNKQKIMESEKWNNDEMDKNLSQLTASNRFTGKNGTFTGIDIKNGQIEFTKYDPKSIMHYSLPRKYFIEPPGDCYLGEENYDLSEEDKKGMRIAYPNVSASESKASHNAEIEKIIKTSSHLSPLNIEALKALTIE